MLESRRPTASTPPPPIVAFLEWIFVHHPHFHSSKNLFNNDGDGVTGDNDAVKGGRQTGNNDNQQSRGGAVTRLQ